MLAFTLNDMQEMKYREWAENHKCKYRHKGFGGGRYVGAIGGADKFTFIPTSLGVISEVKCACGKKLTLQGLE